MKYTIIAMVWDNEDYHYTYHNVSTYDDKATAERCCDQLKVIYGNNEDVSFYVEDTYCNLTVTDAINSIKHLL